MTDITLKSGKVVKIDVSELTVKEYRGFTSNFGDADQENAVISKCAGIPKEEIEELNFQDLRKLLKEILKAANQPLADPN